MKKFKIAIWLIIIAFLGLIIYQNRAFFFTRESLGIDLSFSAYNAPELPVAVYFAAFFIFGWLIAYLFGLAERYSAGKQIRALRQTHDAQQRAIDDMKREVAALKPQPAQPYADATTLQPASATVSGQAADPQPEASHGEADRAKDPAGN